MTFSCDYFGEVSYTEVRSPGQNNFYFLSVRFFGDEALTFRPTMRAEPFQVRNFINGEFVEPISGRYLDNVEPATGKPYSQVADSDANDVDLAVAAAEKAFRDWSKKPAAERSNFLLQIAELIERDLEKFALIGYSARSRKLPIFCHCDSTHGIGGAHH
jgi:hypothetical protein